MSENADVQSQIQVIEKEIANFCQFLKTRVRACISANKIVLYLLNAGGTADIE